MKTRHNIQKTVLEQVKKNTLYGIALLFCTTSIFTTITAGNLTHHNVFNSNKCVLSQNLSGTETNQTDAGFEFLEYRAQVFVDAEMEYELENGLYNNAETNHAFIEAELTLQVEAYNANDFAEAELSTETENFRKINNDAIEAELILQVEAYNAHNFAETELAAETENFMNGNNEPYETELAFQVEIYDAKNFVDAEMANEIESWIRMQHTTKSIESIASIE